MKQRGWLWIWLGLSLVAGRLESRAQVVAVTARLDTNVITVGGTTVLHVQAQVLPAYRSAAERIFSWYVDVLNGNGTVANVNYGALQKSASDNDPQTSSTGTTEGANRRGVYDTFLNLAGAGVTNPVELLTIPVVGVAVGQTRLQVMGGSGVPLLSADFLVAPLDGGEALVGGDYGAAWVDLTVTNAGAVAPVMSLTQTNLGGRTNQFTVRYGVTAGFDYYVEYRDDLNPGTVWRTFPGGPHNLGVYVDITTAPMRFYRVRMVARGGLGPVRLEIVPSGTAGQVRLVYPVTGGYNYTIEYQDNLGVGGWQALPGGPHNSGNVTVPANLSHRFYRLKVAPQ